MTTDKRQRRIDITTICNTYTLDNTDPREKGQKGDRMVKLHFGSVRQSIHGRTTMHNVDYLGLALAPGSDAPSSAPSLRTPL